MIEIPANTRLEAVGLPCVGGGTCGDRITGNKAMSVHIFNAQGEGRVGRPDDIDTRIPRLQQTTILGITGIVDIH